MNIHQIKIDFNVTPDIARYVFVYLIEGKNIYMIDSGVAGSEALIEEYLLSIGRNVSDIKSIFLTHAHPDHIGTAAYFKQKTGCKVYASEGERPWIEDIDKQFRERPIPNFYSLAGQSTPIDCIIKDGDSITLEDGITINVMETPGHSVDELSYIVDTYANEEHVDANLLKVSGDGSTQGVHYNTKDCFRLGMAYGKVILDNNLLD